MLDCTVSNEEIFIDGLSSEIYGSDHPSNTKTGEGLPIRRRTDLELLPEVIISDITLTRKNVFLGILYRSPSQSSQQFETFIDNLQ